MADNVTANPGSGGATFATDDIAGVQFPRMKVVIGADGANDGDVSSSNPLPVLGPLTDAELRASAVPVSGPATDAQLRATPLPVSGPLTDAELRASAITVSQSDSAATTSFGPITSVSTVLFAALDTSNERTVVLQLDGLWSSTIDLQQSNDGVSWWDAYGLSQSQKLDLVNNVSAPDVVTVQVAARYFRAITAADFRGSVSGTYVLRSVDPPQIAQNMRLTGVDPEISVQIAAIDQNNYLTRIRANNFGHLVLADNVSRTDFRSSVGTIVQLETTGYNSVSLQLFAQVAFTATITFQVSNDGTTWAAVAAWATAGGASPVTSATGAGHWVIPAMGRFFRAQVTAFTSGVIGCITTLKSQNSWFPATSPSIAANSSVNVAQFAGTAPVTAGVAGMLAVGGNIAEDTAATSNPLICGGVVRTALPASTVIAGDAIRQTFSASGQLVTKENAPGDLDFYLNATVTTATQTQLRAAQAAGIRTNVTAITYQNTNATATTLTIQDGAATTLITFSVPASMTEPRQLVFPTPLRGTAATALNYTAGTAGASVLLNVTGFNSY